MAYFRFGDDPGRGRLTLAAAVILAHCQFASAPAAAAGGHWTISAVDGTAMVIAQQGKGYAAKQGHPVVAGATLVTGDDGTVVLARRGDSMMVHPNSEVTIPDTSGSDRLGAVQKFGTLLYRMETRESWDFQVRTPFLAATVKGTVFTVAVAADRAMVSVAEGMVRVAPVRGGRSGMVHAGSQASVSAASAHLVTLETVNAGRPSFWNFGRLRGGRAYAGSGNGNSQGRDSQGRESGDGDSRGGDSDGGDSGNDDSQGNQR